MRCEIWVLYAILPVVLRIFSQKLHQVLLSNCSLTVLRCAYMSTESCWSFDNYLLGSSRKPHLSRPRWIRCDGLFCASWHRCLFSMRTCTCDFFGANTVFICAIKLGLEIDVELPLVTILLTIRDGTRINHPTLCFSSSIIPSRMCRTCSAVNTLYIFTFWEVLLDLCVNRVTSLVQETLFVSGRHSN